MPARPARLAAPAAAQPEEHSLRRLADTTDKIINSNQSGAIVGILRNMKYDVDFDLTRNVGHTPTPEIAEKCYQTMRAASGALSSAGQFALQSA